MGEQGPGRGRARSTQVGAAGAAAAWTNRGCAPAGTRARAAFLREPASPPLPWLPGGLEGEGPSFHPQPAGQVWGGLDEHTLGCGDVGVCPRVATCGGQSGLSCHLCAGGFWGAAEP